MAQPLTRTTGDTADARTPDDTGDDSAAMDAVDALVDQLHDALDTEPRNAAAIAAALEAMVAACRRDPRIDDELDLASCLDELSETYDELDRFDDALEAMQAAIAAGYDSTPDPRCRLAELQLRAGRAEAARDLFSLVHTEFPADAWVCHNAGVEYAAAGDYPQALAWLSTGLEIALNTGDPDDLIGQLYAARRDALHALDRSDTDDLDARAAAFLAQHPDRPRRSGAPPGLLDVVEMFAAAASGPLTPTAAIPAGPSSSPTRPGLALAWFPATEYETALGQWPQLADQQAHWASGEHTGYTHQLEGHLRGLAAHAATSGASISLRVAPIHLEAFQTWCARHDRDAADEDTRADYAGDLARTHPSALITWPPERNQPCWCASGRKYKKCCGHPTALDPA
jgi:tetratricopeptide (TPR) repeat protein